MSSMPYPFRFFGDGDVYPAFSEVIRQLGKRPYSIK